MQLQSSVAQGAMALIDDNDPVYRKIAWRLMPFLFVCYVFAYLDRVNVGFAALHMKADLSFSDAVYGLGAGIFFFGYVCCEIPSNLLMKRLGARVTIARIMIGWGFVSCCTMLVHSPTSFYLMRLLLGAFEAGFAPGVLLYLTFWFPPARRAQMAAIFLCGSAIAGVAGAPLSGVILDAFHGIAGLQGWQWLFVIEGVPSIVLGLIALALLSDGPSTCKWLRPDEKAKVIRHLASFQPAVDRGFLAALREPPIHLIALTWFTIVCGHNAVNFWMPMMLREAGLTTATQIGMWAVVPYAFTTIGMILISRHSDQRLERRIHISACSLLAAVGFGMLPFVQGHFGLSIFGLTLAALGVFSAMPIILAMPMSYLPAGAAAGGIAYVNTIGMLGGFVGPYMMGAIKTATGSFANGLFAVTGLLLIGILIMTLMVRTPRLEPVLDARVPAA